MFFDEQIKIIIPWLPSGKCLLVMQKDRYHNVVGFITDYTPTGLKFNENECKQSGNSLKMRW